jgi:uncharacterized protein (DUF952 family)
LLFFRKGPLLAVERGWRKGKKNAVNRPVPGETHLAVIYKILNAEVWRAALARGAFEGAGIDLADGYIHFSTASQVEETAAKHFAGQDDLLLVAVEAEKLGDKLVYEVSRGGALFPHLYAPLPTALAKFALPLNRRADGALDFAGLLE